jgi:TonB-linked SusC/RagA family outer membrane protein
VYAQLQNAAADAAGRARPYSDETLEHFRLGDDPDRYPDPDYREMINENNPITSHNIEISGGTETVKYYGSVGYQYQEGMWKDNDTKNNRFNFSLNLDAKVTKTTNINLGITGRKQDRAYPYTGYSRLWEILLYTHTEHEGPLWFSNGMPGAHFTTLLGAEGYDKTDATNLYTQLSFDQEITVIPGLKARGLVSYDPSYSINKIWNTPTSKAAIDVSKTPYVITLPPPPEKNSLTMDLSKRHQLTYQAGLTYARSFGKHNLSVLTLMEAKTNNSISMGIDKRNYDLSIDEINMGSANLADQTTRGSSGDSKQVGYLYRLIYDYSGKYLFETSARYDGNYYFAPGKRFGFFPAVSVGWRISEEPFMQSVGWLQNLKIRASYGEVGALAGSAFQFLSTYAVYSPATTFGGSAVQGINERSESNPEITWERARKSDIGLDIGLFAGMINIGIDYFYEKRSNMLVNPDVVVPAEYGIGLSQVNEAIMDNQGIDFMIDLNHRFSNDLEVSFNANFTYAHNELIQIFETASTFTNPNRKRTGRSYNTQFGLKAIGYFQEDDFNSDGSLKEGIPTQPWEKLQPGDIRYADMNGDGKIDASNDEAVIGKPEAIPEIMYGFGPDIRYRKFTLSMLFQGVANTDLYLTGDEIWPFYNGMTAYVDNFDFWTTENRDARFPRITSTRTTNNSQTSSWWIESGAYLRLKTLMLAYDIPSAFAKKIRIQNARVYISGENLFTATKLDNWDPETGSNRGENPYPMQKVYALGLNITF